jgi:hypothetical protein
MTTGEKMAMTVPVAQTPVGEAWVVSFMMPARYTMDSLPAPRDRRDPLCRGRPVPPGGGTVQRALEDPVLSHSDPATGLPVGPRPTPVADVSGLDGQTSEAVLALVLKSVDDDKAEDIVQIDLRGRSDVADYMVICSGRSSRQVAAISEKLADRLKQDMRISCPHGRQGDRRLGADRRGRRDRPCLPSGSARVLSA